MFLRLERVVRVKYSWKQPVSRAVASIRFSAKKKFKLKISEGIPGLTVLAIRSGIYSHAGCHLQSPIFGIELIG
jgi:hypothetical protein